MSDPKPTMQGTVTESNDRRRSHRVFIAMPVLVRGKYAGQAFEESTQTVSVSAHGGLVRVAARLVRGQTISIVNAKTAEELPCTVTSLGQKENGKTEVGLEFTEASPLFWRIAFPPEDWDPSERKRPGSSAHRPMPPLPKPTR
ncbi:MAG TPA: PilZ domain-containing protein [Candidatus Baltobacteraceae bacterium]|nr:PilZ domain-containing protein [Candidatus Baltobacteraceae bacterium]